MLVLKWENLLKQEPEYPCALTIGVFDGIHRGHGSLLNKITADEDLSPTVITFCSNPQVVLGGDNFPGNVLSLSQKLSKLEISGIRVTILIDFSRNFSKMDGKNFWISLLEHLDIRKVVVGTNFRFGSERNFDAGELGRLVDEENGRGRRRIGFEIVEPLCYRDLPISSTRIRQAVMNAQFGDVREMLGESFCLDVRAAEKNPAFDGSVFIGLDTLEQVIPAEGTYEVLLHLGGVKVPGMIDITQERIEVKSLESEACSRIHYIEFI